MWDLRIMVCKEDFQEIHDAMAQCVSLGEGTKPRDREPIGEALWPLVCLKIWYPSIHFFIILFPIFRSIPGTHGQSWWYTPFSHRPVTRIFNIVSLVKRFYVSWIQVRQWLTIASADAVILSASNFGVTAAERVLQRHLLSCFSTSFKAGLYGCIMVIMIIVKIHS